jgi:transcription termination/antitermination protein NusG
VNWHVIRTARDREGAAAIGIGGLGLESYMPIELERRDYRGRREIGWRPLFVTYVFARCDPGRDLSRIMAVAGVMDVLRSTNGKPAPVPDEAISTIKQAEQMGAFDRTKQARLVEGDTVAIKGAFGGLIAKIRSARSSRRSALILELVGCPFRVVAPADKLTKIVA